MYRCSVVMDDISAQWSTWEGFLMNGQLEADSSSLVADWSLFNGTPVSLIKRKMNHRYSSPQEHRAQNLIVIGCVAALDGCSCICVFRNVCEQRSVAVRLRGTWLRFCVIYIDPLNPHVSHAVAVRWPGCVCSQQQQLSLTLTNVLPFDYY